MNDQYVITGIGTEVGKTVVSAIVAESLSATYWKPVQAGDLASSDSIKIMTYTSNVSVLQEAFRLNSPMSPHAAAEKDGVKISLDDLQIPRVDGNLIIEGAGGLMVPINNDGLLYIDAFEKWGLPVIVVSRHYLGSINHSLLTIEMLKNRGCQIEGIVFVGDENRTTEEAILKCSGVKMLARIPLADKVDRSFIAEQAKLFQL